MDSSTFCNDSNLIDNDLTKAQCLEMAYKEALSNTNMTVKDEGARRLTLQIRMLENDNDDLHESLAAGDDRIDLLDQNTDELQAQLESTQEESRRRESELKSQAREVNNLRAEVASMQGVSVDSTKLLTEKLSLARELATLKPELEHLRSQATYQQTILSEKLALQRQVSSLEVELETERRATRRAAQKNDNNEKEIALQNQVDSLQKELAKEKKESAKALKEQEKELKAYEARQVVLDTKLEEAKTKLRTTKEQLKECQSELGQARATTVKTTKILTKVDASTRKPRKKGALEISADITGTPEGEGKRTAKRGRLDQTTIGEKSTFSITPFLNRTLNLAPEGSTQDIESHIMAEVEKEDEDEGTVCTRASSETRSLRPDALSPTPLHRSKARKRAGSSTPQSSGKILEEADHNVQTNQSALKMIQPLNKLDEIAEEDADENEQHTPSAVVSPKPITKLLATAKKANAKQPKAQLKVSEFEDEGPKKKKKKLLGTTVFDEDDTETAKRPAKVSLARQRMAGKSSNTEGRGAPKGALASGNAFGAFSPLKKHRKGAGASFVA